MHETLQQQVMGKMVMENSELVIEKSENALDSKAFRC
jgi:hypothetical protein